MENSIDQDIEIILGESEHVTETINDEVTVYEAFPKGSITLRIGNTGFEYFLEKVDADHFESRFDFMPEGSAWNNEKTAAKHAMVLCRALLSLRTWFRNEDNIKMQSIDLAKLPPLKAITNNTLINGFYSLFENHGGHGDFVQSYCFKDCDMTLDLKAFVGLPESDELVQYLQKIRNRTQNLQMSYWKAKPAS